MSKLVWFVSMLIWTLVQSSQPGGSRYTAIEANGYENVTVAISPMVPPEQRSQLIQNLQILLTETSKQLFFSTKQKAYIKQVFFLIPREWTEIKTEENATFQSFRRPDFIVAPQTPLHGIDPYALQSANCGHRGHYVHLTPDFINQQAGSSVKQAKNVVSAWAQYRYGVFEECGSVGDFAHPPLYWKQTDLAMTSCSAQPLTGSLEGECDPVMYLSQGQCQFVPNSDQTPANPSITFSTELTEGSQHFCDDNTHNQEAPNKQNTLCKQKSAWAVIDSSKEMSSVTPENDPNFDTTPMFQTVKAATNKFVIIAEKSMHMNEKMNNIRLGFSKVINHHIPDGTKVGLVMFDDQADTTRNMTTLNTANRKPFIKGFPAAVAPGDSGVNIPAAIREGLKLIRNEESSIEKGGRSTLVMITGGMKDNKHLIDATDLCIEMSASQVQLNVMLYIDQNAKNDKELTVLQQLTICTGGRLHVFGDIPKTDSYHALTHELIDNTFHAVVDIDDPLEAPVQIYFGLHNAETKPEGEKLSDGWFFVDEAKKKQMTFYVSYDDRKKVQLVTLTDPSGRSYLDNDNDQVFDDDEGEKHISATFSDVQTGNWSYKVEWLDPKEHLAIVKAIAIPKEEQIRVNGWVKIYNEDLSNEAIGGKTPVVFYAELMRGQTPIVNAHVQVSILLPSKDSTIRERIRLNLTDDGSGDPDISKHDGIYSRYFTGFTNPGFYSFWVVANDNNGKATLLMPTSSNQQKVPGLCTINQVDTKHTGSFRRSASGEAFYVSRVEPGSDLYPPSRVSDLHVAEIRENKVTLRWTAVGNNYDNGIVESYEIRSSKSRKQMTESGFASAEILEAVPTPIAPAKEEQEARFIVEERKTPQYIAIRAYDGTNYGPISNVITVVRQSKDIEYPTATLPGLNTTEPPNIHKTSGLTTGAIVGIIIALIAIIAIIGLVFIVKKRKNRQRTKQRNRRNPPTISYDPIQQNVEEMPSRVENQHENNSTSANV